MDKPVKGADDADRPLTLYDAFSSLKQGDIDWAGQTMLQIEKDFGLQGMKLSLPAANPGLALLAESIASEMRKTELLGKQKLLGLLYQLDISEPAIRSKLSAQQNEDPYYTLALEIVKRCFTKVYLRSTLK